jgi:hypothetical protein
MNSMETYQINLQNFRTAGSKVFTGRDRGQQDRNASKIDEVVEKYPNIEIVIPSDIYSINPSYLEEFFVDVVQLLGKDGFFKKFTITNPGPYKISKDLNEAIDRILREKNALL